MNAIRQRTEYLKNPLGIDIKHPRLMWNCEGGKKQTAYQIVTENWDSGKVASSSMWAEYPKGLHDRERVTWKVRLWDENDEPGDWAESFFERGISSWEAKWITGNYTPSKRERYPAATVSTYTWRLMASGMSATVSAISLMRLAFLRGSSPASSNRRLVLKAMPSFSLSRI